MYGDESGFAVKMPRLSGYSSVDGDVSCYIILARKNEFSKILVKNNLLSKLPEKSLFVIDNTSCHKHEKKIQGL